MNRILIAFTALLFIGPASAVIVEQKIGPYSVTFDLTNSSMQLNSSASYWDEYRDDSHPSVSWGTVYVVLKNRPSHEIADIKIIHSKTGTGLIFLPEGLGSRLEAQGFQNVKTYTRTIDGDKGGILTEARMLNGSSICYLAEYRLNRDTIVDITSWMPMDGGTGDLLNTIHVAELTYIG